MKETHYYQREGRKYLSAEGQKFLLDNNLLIDATEGGLVIGPQLAEGGVTLINLTDKGEMFINKPVNGWCYLLNAYAFFHGGSQLNGLKATLLQSQEWYCPYNVAESVRAFDASPQIIEGEQITPFIYVGATQTAFIGPVETKNHLELIDEVNKKAWQQYHKGYKQDLDINATGAAAHLVPRSNN